MARRYAIWDKKCDIYTPAGETLTAEDWINRYTWIRNPITVPIVAAGLFNGAFCGELSQMKDMYESGGAHFDENLTDEELLLAIEEYEKESNKPNPNPEPSAQERIAAALEYQNMMMD